jgi:hypothetical protein
MQVPAELAQREKRLAEIARAKAVIEARAKERHAREQAEYEAKMAARDAKAAQTGGSLAVGCGSRRLRARCRPIRST